MSETTENTAIPTGDDSMVVSDVGYDLKTMRDISLAESIEEEKNEAAQDSGATESDSDTDGTTIKSTSSDTKGDKPSEQTEEEESEVTEEGSTEEQKPGTTLELQHGDRKLAIPKDAKVTLKVGGEQKTMTVQEALNKASGVINVEQENSRLGRERKTFTTQKEAFEKETQIINQNAQALLDIEDPIEFCEYYGALKGEDPQKVFEGLVNKVAEHIDRYQNMTEGERALAAENRRLKVQQRRYAAKAKTEESNQKLSGARESLTKELQSEGLTQADFDGAVEEMREKLQKGESLGEEFDSIQNLTPSDIVDYAVARSLNQRVSAAIQAVNPAIATEPAFMSKLTKAIYATERLHGKMKSSEVTQFVKAALDLDNKNLSENLSKKVKSRTNSQSVSSQKQDEDDEGPVNYQEWRERNRFLP